MIGALVWLETSSPTTAAFNLLDLGLGSAYQDSAAWRTGPVDWTLDNDFAITDLVINPGSGSVVVEITAEAGAFDDATFLRIPAWSQTVRGPRGEWIVGYIPVPGA